MTLVRDGWDLYICHFLMQTREYNERAPTFEKVLVEQSYYIESVLFSSDSKDSAFDWVVEMMPRLGDVNHDGKYDLTEFGCVGIYNLDNTQTATGSLYDEVISEIGFTVDCINIENIDVNKYIGKPQKSALKLFSSD